MTFTLVPALEVQRQLYDRPRDPDRFRAYLHELTGGGDDLRLPLSNFNPMAREHAAEAVAHLIDLDAEAIAGDALATVNQQLKTAALRPHRLALVVADDLGGMWTHRATTRAEVAAGAAYDDWLVATFWTSAPPPSEDDVRIEVRTTAYRAAYLQRRGAPANLDRTLRQEALAATFARVPLAPLDAVERARVEAALRPLLQRDDRPVILPALCGDDAAEALGYTPLGLGDGDAIAIARIECRNTNPVEALLAAPA